MIVQNSVITLMPKPLFSVSMCGNQINSDWSNCLQTESRTSNNEGCFERCSQFACDRNEEKDVQRDDSTVSTSSTSFNVKSIQATPKSTVIHRVYNRKKKPTRRNFSFHGPEIDNYNELDYSSDELRELFPEDGMDMKISAFDLDSVGESDAGLMTEPVNEKELICTFTSDFENDVTGTALSEIPLITAPNNLISHSLDEPYCVDAACQTSDGDDHLPNHCLEYNFNEQVGTDYAENRTNTPTRISSGSSSLKRTADNDINEKSFVVYHRKKKRDKFHSLCYKRSRVSSSSHFANSNDQLSYSVLRDQQTDGLLKMLICRRCREAFHLFCGVPQGEMVEVKNRYCDRCRRKRLKLVLNDSKRGNSVKALKGTSAYKEKLRSGSSLLSLMLEETEGYCSGVCVGPEFQADVPEWSGPIISDMDCGGQPVEVDDIESLRLHGLNAIFPAGGAYYGNWLQCREVIVDHTRGVPREYVCGKWRRAPLFEAQTDEWDCSCCVVWDPVHADCAVPQEISTEEVMLHLKYVKLLKQPLAR